MFMLIGITCYPCLSYVYICSLNPTLVHSYDEPVLPSIFVFVSIVLTCFKSSCLVCKNPGVDENRHIPRKQNQESWKLHKICMSDISIYSRMVTIFPIGIWTIYGCFLKWWYPQNTPK